ncbi:uncharacterized protein C8A04DRAFT_24507 [Dichotomopilus funicola]|uniref:Ankyrin n=1 Tax=Dichotomopilus funicola TaxID=1934379 RepID=A0AAN6V9L5_9PEZI|nr:hypothetical protein C8A04DRAFT_24507 [Dichotomopilus funicola]
MAQQRNDEPKEPPPLTTADRPPSSDNKEHDTSRPSTSPRTSTAHSPHPRPRPSYSSHAEAEVAGPVDFSELPGLPRLRYRILEYKLKLFTVVSLLVLESSILPIALYYGLILGTTLRAGIVFAIITSFFGIVTGIEFALRCFKLIFRGDTYRPVGGTRWSFDFTHWTLSFGYTIMTGVLIGASIPHNPLVRPLAMPVSFFFIQIGLQLVWSGWMNRTGRAAPCKISSVPKGGRVPPLVFTLVEDVVGVDGAGGREYRNALLARYEASPRFRKMMAQQNWFWAVGALVNGVGTMAVIWTVPERVAYGVDVINIKTTTTTHLINSNTTIITTMPPTLGALPPELILHIADFLDLPTLAAAIASARYLHTLLWKRLYQRDATHHNSNGLIRCIRSGVPSALTRFLTAGGVTDINARINMSPDIQDFYGYTLPLATAVVRGRRDMARLLLDHGADVAAPVEGACCFSVPDHAWADVVSKTPLSVAITEGHDAIAEDLVERLGPSSTSPDEVVSEVFGVAYTALEQAALFLRPGVVRRLLQRGANPNRRQRGGTDGGQEPSSLLYMILTNHVLRAWTDEDPDEDDDADGSAGPGRLTETVMVLLEYGADPFAKEECPLHSGEETLPGGEGELECRCGVTACSVGMVSPYVRLQRHFVELEHRQRCPKLGCRDSQMRYGLVRDTGCVPPREGAGRGKKSLGVGQEVRVN